MSHVVATVPKRLTLPSVLSRFAVGAPQKEGDFMDLRDCLQAIALSTLAFAPIGLGMLLGTRNGIRQGLRDNAGKIESMNNALKDAEKELRRYEK